jgi:O-antigen/teichoic acid export membrane protein
VDVVTRVPSGISRHDRLVYRNTLANLLGFVVGAAISLFNAPILFRIIGPTEYGLIAVFQLALVIAPVFDYGVSLVLNREVASRSDGYDVERVEAGVALKTAMGSLELLIVAIAVALAVLMVGASGWLTTDWFKVSPAEAVDARLCLMIGAASLCIQRVRVFGMAVMSGRQKQVEMNLWTTVMSLLRMGLGLAVVFLYSPQATAYLWVQLALSIAEAWLFHARAWQNVATADAVPFFSLAYVKSVIKPLMANWGAVAAATAVLSADKLILSGSIDIRTYGQYSLIASAVTSLGGLVVTPSTAFLPRLTASVVGGDRRDISATLASFSTITAALSIPALTGVAVFGDRVIALLLGAARPAPELWSALVLLAVGNALGTFTRVAHSLQIAHNRPDIALKFNAVGAPFYVALCWYCAHRWGLIGVAGVWAAFNAVYLILFLMATDRAVGMGSVGRWLLAHLVAPTAVSLALFGIAKRADMFGLAVGLTLFAVAGCASTFLCLMMNPELRRLPPIAARGLVTRIKRAVAGF